MKLSDIILEYGEYNEQEDALQAELSKRFDISRVYVSMGTYAGGREDDDPLKDMSYGKVTFMVKSEFEDSEWKEMVNYIEEKGYTITQDSNYFDEDPGERYWYPSINFNFKA